MLVDKIIYDLKESIRAYSNDAVVSNSRLLHLVDVTRAKYIRQYQQRNLGESSIDYIQTLLLTLERADKSYLPALPLGKQILRSVKEIPRLVGRNVYKNIEIRPLDRTSLEIEYMDKQRAIYAPMSRKNFIFAFLDDDRHMYFIGQDTLNLFLTRAAVTAILEVPEEIVAFNELTTNLEDYPISEHMWAIMKPELLDLLFKELNIPIDTLDDNKAVQ